MGEAAAGMRRRAPAGSAHCGVGRTQAIVAYPGVDVMPYLSPLALALGVLGALPAVATPVPASAPVRQEVAA